MTKFDTELILNHEGPHKSGDPIRGTLVVETDDWLDVDTITIAIDQIACAADGPSTALPQHRAAGDPVTIHNGRMALGRHEIPWELETPETASRRGQIFDVRFEIVTRIDLRHQIIELEPVDVDFFADTPFQLVDRAIELSEVREARKTRSNGLPVSLGILGLMVGIAGNIAAIDQIEPGRGAFMVLLFVPVVTAALGVLFGNLMRAAAASQSPRSGIEDASLEITGDSASVKLELRVATSEDLHFKEISLALEGAESARTLGSDPVTQSHTFSRVHQVMLEDESVESGWSHVFTLTKDWDDTDLPSESLGNYWVSWVATATIDELGALPFKLRMPVEVKRRTARLLDTGGPVVATEAVLDFDEDEPSDAAETVDAKASKPQQHS